MIKVLIAEDSPFVAAIMREALREETEITVVGWAKNGQEAIDLRNSLNPDVITMDLNMPVMSGLKAIQTIALTRPLPILVVSQMIESRDSELAFEALRSGAVDIMGKPSGNRQRGFSEIKDELISRIKAVSRIRPIHLIRKPPAHPPKAKAARKMALGRGVVVMGASTGGPPALATILKGLPQSFLFPIAIVQHIAPGFVTGLSHWLEREAPFRVKVAGAGETLSAGNIYLAPDNHHLKIGGGNEVVLEESPPVKGHRPAIDRLMESAAHVYGRGAIGVLLTGMGNDGAQGLKKIREAGGRTIVQDEATSLVFGMPREAILLGAAEIVSPLERIAEEIVQATPIEEEKIR